MSTAELLSSNKDEILKKWLDRVGQEMPIIKSYDKAAIENSVPDLLNAIVKNLETEDDGKVLSTSRIHGQQRASFRNYSLRHIIKEYNLLKTQILHLVDSQDGSDPKDRDSIMFVIDHAIEEAAEMFHVVKQGVHVKARKAAEKKANELELEDDNREEFIQSITHDLNNPLNNIKGCIYLLEMDLDIHKISKLISILKTSANQAELLVKDFLDVGKISISEKIPVNKSQFNIVDELENQLEVYRISHDIEIDFQPGIQEISVSLDLDLFRRCMGNLMNNALKHNGNSASITVSCNIEDDHLEVAVQNFGKAIPEHVLQNIFNRYYKASTEKKGWGIGLAFVKEVMKAHGGEVTAESTEKDGTIFTLIFPYEEYKSE